MSMRTEDLDNTPLPGLDTKSGWTKASDSKS